MPDLIAPQPAPVANDLPASWDLVVDDLEGMATDRIARAVIKDMRERDQFGYDKYGVRIQPHNGRDNLVDAYQEVLDGAVYFRSALYEFEEAGDGAAVELRGMYQEVLSIVLRLRAGIAERDGE